MMHVCIKSTINVSKFPVRPMDLYCRIHSKSADYKRGPTSKARPKFSDLASRTLQDWPQCLFIPNAEDTLHGQVLMTVDCIGAPSGRILKPNSSHTKSCNNHTWFLNTQPYGVSEPYLQYFILNGCICWWMWPNKLTNGKPKIQGAHESTRGSTYTLLKTNMSPLQNGCLENDPASFSGLIFRGEKNVSF